MLENPRSIQVLNKIKEYQSELKKHMEDSEIWLNKSTDQGRVVKTKVIQIFMFFSQICQEKAKRHYNDDPEEEQEGKPQAAGAPVARPYENEESTPAI